MLTPPHGIHSSGGPSWGMPPPSLPSFSERRGASFPGSSPLRPVRGAGRLPGHSGWSGARGGSSGVDGRYGGGEAPAHMAESAWAAGGCSSGRSPPRGHFVDDWAPGDVMPLAARLVSSAVCFLLPVALLLVCSPPPPPFSQGFLCLLGCSSWDSGIGSLRGGGCITLGDLEVLPKY